MRPATSATKTFAVASLAVATLERRNEFRIGIDSAERPDVAELWIVVNADVLFFFADKAPDFIHLQTGALKIPHFGIHQGRASLADLHAKPHDRIAVNASHALNRADAGTLASAPMTTICLSVLSTFAMT